MHSTPTKLIVFTLDSVSFAVDVDHVQRVIPACAITPFPETSIASAGFIRFDGAPIPVIDPASLFRGKAPSRLGIASRFLLMRPRQQMLALIADNVTGVWDMPVGSLTHEAISAGFSRLRGIAAGLDDLVYIVDPERILTLDEEARIDAALTGLAEPVA